MENLIEELRISDEFDLIIFDCPPLLGLSDSFIISNYVDATILTVSLNKVNKNLAKECLKKLNLIKKPIIGTIVNSVSKQKNINFSGGKYYSYGNKYNYYTYKYMPAETQNRYSSERNELKEESNTFFKNFSKKTLLEKAKFIINSLKQWLDE